MTTKVHDTGSILYDELDAAGRPAGTVDYRAQSGANTVRRVKSWVPAHTVIRDGVRFHFKKRSIANSPPPVRASGNVTSYNMTSAFMRSRVVSVGGPHNPPISAVSSDFWYAVPIKDGLINSGWDANDTLKLMGKLREKLLGSDFNAGIFLAEGSQTLRMVADSAIRIAKAYHHLSRGDISGTARSLFDGTSRSPLKPYESMKSLRDPTTKALSSNWLELQYGWLPLVKDAAAGAEFVAHKLSMPLEMKTKASQRRINHRRSFIYDGWYPGNDPVLPYFGHVVGVDVIEQRTLSVYHREETPSLAAQLGLTDPASVLWEKLPWSFVADWFIPIGQYLSARGLTAMYAGNRNVSVTRISKFATITDGQQSPDGHLDTFGSTGWIGKDQGSKNFVNYSRIVSDGAINVPFPEFKPLAKAASWQHAVNAVALLTQKWAGR